MHSCWKNNRSAGSSPDRACTWVPGTAVFGFDFSTAGIACLRVWNKENAQLILSVVGLNNCRRVASAFGLFWSSCEGISLEYRGQMMRGLCVLILDTCAVSPGGGWNVSAAVQNHFRCSRFLSVWRLTAPTASNWLFKRTGTQRQQLWDHRLASSWQQRLLQHYWEIKWLAWCRSPSLPPPHPSSPLSLWYQWSGADWLWRRTPTHPPTTTIQSPPLVARPALSLLLLVLSIHPHMGVSRSV